jgi:long-chain acyl-CoA synthetase
VSNFWSVFAATAVRAGERTAIEVQRGTGLERVSYGALRTRAETVAGWLAGQGVSAGDRCAILADNDADWCAAYLGILRLGAIAVPLDTNYTAAQVATIVSDSGTRALLAGPRLWETAADATASLTDVRLASVAGPSDVGTAPALAPCPATAADPAVILYTSGTTADPKGVVLSHGNLDAERAAAFQVVDVHERDSVLGVLPLFHALAQVGNLLLPLALGARVVFLETLNTTELLRALRERGTSIFVCVPQFFYLIHERVRAEVARAGPVGRAAFSTLLAVNRQARRGGVNLGPLFFRRVHAVMGSRMRLLVTGGSKFDPAIGADLYALGFTILQAYGLTETSGAATITRPDEAHLDTVGRPLPGVDIQIRPADAAGDEAALGGEIAIRGPIVMQGYFNRPDATAQVMRDGWFLTGDLGRFDKSGRLTITGRSKEVIVLASGKNLHPEEIEAHYRQSAFVREVCVLGVPAEDGHHSERLHALVVPDRDALAARRIANAGELLRFEIEGLTAALPPHKRVLGFDVWMDPFPRTTTGKLKRHEIRRLWEASRRARVEQAATPLTADEQTWLAEPYVEAAVAAIAAQARPGARVTPDANLELDLGLDSMRRVEAITAIEQRFGARLDPERAHEVVTVRQLVEALRPPSLEAVSHAGGDPWAALLRDLPPVDDPALGGLLEERPLFARAAFVMTRALRVALARVDVRGLEHLPSNGPFLICPNHQSYLDPFLLCGVLPFATLRHLFFVGATEYFETPLLRRFARLINLVPVDPDANLVPAMQAGAFGLSHGKILVLFPEGERSLDGTVKRFKKGAPILSRCLGVPVVPVAIRGVFEIWPRNHPPDLRVIAPWSGHRVRIAFGPPVTFDGSVSDDVAAGQLREIVAELWEREGKGKE